MADLASEVADDPLARQIAAFLTYLSVERRAARLTLETYGRDLEARKRLYQTKRIRPGTKRYHSIDTLYALSEVAVFAAAIDELEAGAAKLDYPKLFEDIRSSIDQAHRDGSIKDRIKDDPDRFIVSDPALGPTLHKLRSSGKKLFLLTNSEPRYTESTMRYLLDGSSARYPSFQSYFDVIIASANKPAFFTGSNAFRDANTDNPAEELQRGQTYVGGSLLEFERLTAARGDRVLYVGDHIYGDVLRTKKVSAWRTLMVIQEMTDELEAMAELGTEIKELDRLEGRRYELLDNLRDRQALFKLAQRSLDEEAPQSPQRTELEATRLRIRRDVERLRLQIKSVEGQHGELARLLDRAYHPFWGSCFKAGTELSSFGEQVERYACLYTDRVANLGGYSPNHYFRGPRHRMAHE